MARHSCHCISLWYCGMCFSLTGILTPGSNGETQLSVYFFVVLWDVFQFDWCFNTGEQDLDIGISVFLCSIVWCISV